MVKAETNYIHVALKLLTMKNVYSAILCCIIVQCLFGFASNLISFDSADMESHVIIANATNACGHQRYHVLLHNNNSFAIAIGDIFSIWRELFNSVMINDNCEIDDRFLSHLLNHTQRSLHQLVTVTAPNRDQYRYRYHDMIALRRAIMIIVEMESMATMQPIHNKLIGYFMKLFETYLTQRSEYPWFHVHVSKSGGTSVKETFYKTFGVKGSTYYWNVNDPPCGRQYRAHSGLRYVEREQALFTHNDYKRTHHRYHQYHGPSLCNKFIYILPFREPLERICSQSSQMNKHPIFNNQNILRTYTSYQQLRSRTGTNSRNIYHHGTGDRMDRRCYNQNITINGVDYRALLEPLDYRHFFVELLESELDKAYMALPEVKSNQDVWARIEKTSIKTENITSLKLSQCWKHPEQLRWTPLRYTGNASQLERSQFILVTKKNGVDIAWHRCISASNVFTSWLGYNYSKEIVNFAMISNYVPRYSINESHFINAMNILLQMDYVLPFESFAGKKPLMIHKDHHIWRIMLQHIYHYFNRTTLNIKWKHLNPSGYTKEKISALEICASLSRQDREILEKYNQFDYKLYNISKRIEIADVLFYKLVTDSPKNFV